MIITRWRALRNEPHIAQELETRLLLHSKMDVRELFAAYKLRKRKISETEEIKEEMPLHVSHEIMFRPVEKMAETLDEKEIGLNLKKKRFNLY